MSSSFETNTFFTTKIYPLESEEKVRKGHKVMVWRVEDDEFLFFRDVQHLINEMDFQRGIHESYKVGGKTSHPIVRKLYCYTSQLQFGSDRMKQIVSGAIRPYGSFRKIFRGDKVYRFAHMYIVGQMGSIWFSIDYDAFEELGFVIFRISKTRENVANYKRYNPIQHVWKYKHGYPFRFGHWLLPRVNAFIKHSTRFDIAKRNCQDFFNAVFYGNLRDEYKDCTEWPVLDVGGKRVTHRVCRQILNFEEKEKNRFLNKVVAGSTFVVLVCVGLFLLWRVKSK